MAHRLLAGVITMMFFFLTACSPEPVTQDLGHLSGSGKPDFAGFDFNLPVIKKSGSLTFSFTAEGSFELRLTQPGIASSKQATARLILDDGAQTEETGSSKTPVIEWQADGDGLMSYTLTVKNRSSTRTLTARLVGEVLEPDFPYAPPSSGAPLPRVSPSRRAPPRCPSPCSTRTPPCASPRAATRPRTAPRT